MTSTEPRTPLSTERILRAAVDLADTQGLDGLSMRKVATELGFEVMSLYNHVANKDEMLAGMVDTVAAEIEHPAGPDWQPAMRASAVSAHDVLLAHPWTGGLWSSVWPGPARIEFMESILRTLREAGFSPTVAYHGYHAITMHIVGFTIQQLGYGIMADAASDERVDRFLSGLQPDRFPHLTEHVQQHVDGSESGDFEFVLDLILDGLERLR